MLQTDAIKLVAMIGLGLGRRLGAGAAEIGPANLAVYPAIRWPIKLTQEQFFSISYPWYTHSGRCYVTSLSVIKMSGYRAAPAWFALAYFPWKVASYQGSETSRQQWNVFYFKHIQNKHVTLCKLRFTAIRYAKFKIYSRVSEYNSRKHQRK